MSPSDSQGTPAQDPATPAADLSKYIRTYAKDVAHVSGKGNVGALQKIKTASAQPATEPEKLRGRVSNGVEFAATTQPFIEQSRAREGSLGAPVTIESRAELASFVEPQTPPATGEEREAVLARLRAKMAAQKIAVPGEEPATPIATPAPIPPPVFATPVSAPVFAMPPVYREPITEVVPQPALAPLPKSSAPIPVEEATEPSRFHSFSTDFKDRSKETNSSSFTVLAAGLDAGQAMSTTKATPRERPPVLAIAFGVMLLVLASGGSYALYLYVGARHEVPAITLRVPSLIFADAYKKIDGTGRELMQALATTANDPLLSGTALVTYVGYPATGEAGTLTGTPAPGGFLIAALALPAPDLLTRNIDDSSTVGVINEGGDTRAFFILRVSSYERTFAGMLTWEPLMTRDLGLLYPMYIADETPVPQVDLGLIATTTATTSVSMATTTAPAPAVQVSPAVSVGRFEDAIVANRDVRILRDTRGRSLMLYGYADKETLIIARNEAAFAALLVRLSAGGK